MSTDLVITEPLLFSFEDAGGTVYTATVEEFNASLGFNNTASTLNLTLVLDEKAGQTQFPIGSNIVGEGVNPGTFIEYTLPNSNFVFGGFIQNVQETFGMSGRKFTVQLADLRVLFRNLPIVTSLNSFGTTTQSNIIDHFNRFGGDIIAAGWTPEGILWSSLRDSIENFVGRFFGRFCRVTFDSSFANLIPTRYVVAVEDPTLDSLLTTVAQQNALDYYCECRTGNIVLKDGITQGIVITIKGINRKEQNIGPDIQEFLNARGDRVISYNKGKELRLDPNNVVVWGDNVKTIYNSVQGWPNTVPAWALFEIFNDGSVTDRPFVSLEDLEANDPTFLDNIPKYDFEKKILQIEAIDGEFPRYLKKRLVIKRPGYFVNEQILRGALHSREAWATAVWYTYKNTIRRQNILNLRSRDLYDNDDANTLGEHVISEGTLESVGIMNQADAFIVPERLGIKSPMYDINIDNQRQSAHNFFMIYHSPADRLLMDAVYQKTRETADNIYGKKFIIRLPDSTIINNVKNNGSAYEYLRRRLPIEYEITEAAWPHLNLDNLNIDFDIPFPLKHSDSKVFQSTEGQLRGVIRYDIDFIRAYHTFLNNNDPMLFWNGDATVSLPSYQGQLFTYPQLFQFPTDTAIKVPKTGFDSEQSLEDVTTNFHLYVGGTQIEQFLYDPRFAIVTLNIPMDLNYSFTRVVTPAENNSLPEGEALYEGPIAQYVKEGGSGAEEYASWLYQYYNIVPGKNIPNPNNDVRRPAIDIANGNISANYYSSLIYYAWQDAHFELNNRLAFGPKRLTQGYFDYYIPLTWNYERYGPFTPNLFDVGGAQVISDSNLSPWKWGSMARMNVIGAQFADSARAKNSLIQNATVSVVGFPDVNLGSQEGINANLTDISFSFSKSGVTTTYKFRSFAGPTPLQKKGDFDAVARANAQFSVINKDEFKIDTRILRKQQDIGLIQKVGARGSTSAFRYFGETKGGFSFVGSSSEPNVDITNDTDIIQGSNRYADARLWSHRYIAGVNTLFQPYSTDPNHVESAHFFDTPSVDSLNPFLNSKFYSDVPYNDTVPNDYFQDFNGKAARSVGLRTPMALVGWGYDTFGKPVPNESDDGQSDLFINGLASGQFVPPSNYIAGPLDVRWDNTRKLWTLGQTQSFFAKIMEIDADYANATRPFFKYGWQQVDFNTDGEWSATGLRGEADSPSGAWNLKEIWSDIPTSTEGERFNLPFSVPSGSLIQMRIYTPNIPGDASGDDAHDIRYVFEWDQEFFLAEITDNEIFDEEKPNQFRWKYKFKPVKFDPDQQAFVEVGNFVSDIEQNFAINTVEWNNPDCGEDCCGEANCCEGQEDCNDPAEDTVNACVVNPGVNVCGPDYPAGFKPQAISNGTIVNMRILPGWYYVDTDNNINMHRYCFEAYNAHDGTCAEEEEG